jgi:hypothetical protein
MLKHTRPVAGKVSLNSLGLSREKTEGGLGGWIPAFGRRDVLA